MPHDYHDQYQAALLQISTLKAALNDIAASEPIPTPSKGWEFCRDVARAALQEAAR